MTDLKNGEPVKRDTYNLLFVCTGNTCRSPMAEAIARHKAKERGWTHVAVRSAGVAAADDAPAAANAVSVAAEHGLDLGRHVSRPLSDDLIGWADLILGMGPGHVAAVARRGGAEKAALVTEFVAGDGTGEPIADPFGSDVEVYRRAFRELDRSVSAVFDRLEPILAP